MRAFDTAKHRTYVDLKVSVGFDIHLSNILVDFSRLFGAQNFLNCLCLTETHSYQQSFFFPSN